MPKKIIDLAALRALNRGPSSIGPGVVRLAANDAGEAEVFIFGDIGGWWDGVDAEEFAKELAALDVDTLNVRLNSPGGFVFDGLAIYNAIARHSARTVVHIDGIAASIASIIAMAGDEIRISEGSSVMIHKPWSIAIGDANAMRKEGEVLDELEGGLLDIYEARTGQKRDDLQEWVDAETWFRGKRAVENGFADVLVPAKKKDDKAAHARSAMLPRFRNTPIDILAQCDQSPEVRKFELFLRDAEGLSLAQAKRIAALAKAAIEVPRDVEPRVAPRDAGAAHYLMRLAADIRPK